LFFLAAPQDVFVILSLPEAPALLVAFALRGVAPEDGEGSPNARRLACAA
jgi:hypothetical protein